jgi:hypothetical protein
MAWTLPQPWTEERRPPLLGNHKTVSTSAHTDSFRHAIAAKISCAVAGSVGAVSCFIDSALK